MSLQDQPAKAQGPRKETIPSTDSPPGICCFVKQTESQDEVNTQSEGAHKPGTGQASITDQVIDKVNTGVHQCKLLNI